MTLALDYARCHDSKCAARADCKRYRDRKKYGPGTPHIEGCKDRERFIPVDEAAVIRWIA